MNIAIDWADRFANRPRFMIADIAKPTYPAEADPVWERREGMHRAQQVNSPFVHYFYTDGRPTEGFGGRRFAGTLVDGTKYEYKGAWSSRCSCVNEVFPDREPITEVVTGSYATAMPMRTIIEWWLKNADKCGFGLAVVKGTDAPFDIEPTRDGKIKNEGQDYWSPDVLAHLAPETALAVLDAMIASAKSQD